MNSLIYIANVRFPSERAHATQIAHMCQAFAKMGVKVTLLTSDRKKGDEDSAEDSLGFIPNFAHRMVANGWSFKTNSKFFFFTNLLAFLCLTTFKTRFSDYDVVYIRDEYIVWGLSFIVSPKKLVWESHEAKFNFPARWLLKHGVLTVCISEAVRDFYLSRGVKPQQLQVADDGIGANFFDVAESQTVARKALALPLEGFYAAYIGGFDTWKGIETFFESSTYMPQGVTLAAIGGKEEEVEKFRVRYPKVTFLGARPYEELARNQQAFDVLVIPNTAKNDLSAKYTSPLKLFAHMASGVPVVASDISSVTSIAGRELVTLFTPDDPKALAEAIEEVRAQYTEKKEKAERLRQVAAGYTWDKRAAKIISFLNQART